MKCYTVGHSTYEIEEFVELLKKHGINCIVDVRSSPYSKFVPQFNKDDLKSELKTARIQYLHLGHLLGARWKNRKLLNANGVVDFSKVSETDEFNNGLDRVISGIVKGYTIGIMCSEKDPYECHRFALISKYLSRRGVEITHVLSKEKVTTHAELESRLVEESGLPLGQIDLFGNMCTVEDALEVAYSTKNIEIGYNALEEK